MFYNNKTDRYEVARTKDWHQWFAWKPITIGEQKVWLKRVYRRGYRYDLRTYLIGNPPKLSRWVWEYAPDLFSIISTADEPFPPVRWQPAAGYSRRRPPPPPPKV